MASRFYICLTPLVTVSLLVGFSVMGCRTVQPDPMLSNPPTQRTIAQSIYSLGTYSGGNNIDTMMVAGIVQKVNWIDSTAYNYDGQQRLTAFQKFDVVQQSAYLRSKATYDYQETNLMENIEIKTDYWETWHITHPLDADQRRLLAFNVGHFFKINREPDAQRTYSAEGILTSSVGIFNQLYRATKLAQRKATVDNGNVTEFIVYAIESGRFQSRTSFEYDTRHYEPLSVFTFLGDSNRNALLSQTTSIYAPDGVTIESGFRLTYDNKYDKQGRLIRRTEYIQDGLNTMKKTASYVTKYYY